jgi:glycosyltransferase involved in cell wall biosynthesis
MTDQNFKEIVQKLKPIELAPLPARPLVSVLMANYNYGRYIGEAIESVLAQTYQHFELIVCDDGSTDNSREVIEPFVSRDSRVRLVSKENGGVASALNAACAVSRGEIICLLDADDLFLPEKLEKVVEGFRKFPRSGFCIHRINKMDKGGRVFSYPRPMFFAEGWMGAEALRRGGLVRSFPPASGISFRRTVTDLFFPIPPHLRRMVDGYLCCIAQFFTEVCVVRSVLTRMRIHGENITSSAGFTADVANRFCKDLSLLISLMKEVLAVHYGNDVAEKLRLEDNSLYCSFLVALHVLNGKRSNEVCGKPLESIVQNIRPYRQRLLIWLLLALPPRLSLAALQAWTGQSADTAMVVRTARSLLRI